VITVAIVDRITFGGNIIETGTDSYRLAQTRARHPPTSQEPHRGPGWLIDMLALTANLGYSAGFAQG
jgi:hypothetical protein